MNLRTDKQKLILHIGIHRTGSTSIQRVLHANRDALHSQGFHYALNTVNHTSLANDFDRNRSSAQSCVDKLVEDAASFPNHTVIVSGEDLCRIRNVQWLAAFKAHFDVSVLCYVRRQDDWLESWYNQHIKWPWDTRFATASPDEFFACRSEFDWLHYAAMLGRWADVFGRQYVIVRPFEQGQLLGSVVEDFCSQCDIDFSGLSVPPHTHNASISAISISLLRHLGLLNKVGEERIYLLSRVNKAVAAAGLGEGKHVFTPAQRLAYLGQFASDNETIARDFLGRSDGRLFFAEPPSVGEPLPDLSLPQPPELVRQIIRPIVMDYLSEIERLLGPHDAASEAMRARFRLMGERSRLLDRRAQLLTLCSSKPALLARARRQLIFRNTDHFVRTALATPPAGGHARAETFTEATTRLSQMLGAVNMDMDQRDQLAEVLAQWQGQHPDFNPDDLETDSESFVRDVARPLVDLLCERRGGARRLASLQGADKQATLAQEEAAVEQLVTEIHALESKVANPFRCGVLLWRLIRSPSP